MVALASAFVRVRPELDKPAFKKAGDEAGQAAGESYGNGFKRGSDGKLRDSNGKFVKDSEALGSQAGVKAGGAFGDGFSKGGSGKISGFLKENAKLAAGVFVPLGIAGAVAEIGKIGIAYENNLNIFKTVSGATAKQMGEVADKARALGADVKLPGVSAAGAAAAMTELAKAGFTVQQSMDAAQATLQLARVANISEGDAATIAANAVNAFGIQAKDTTFVVDELAAAANSSSIEISDASDAFKQAAAVFSGLQAPVVGGKEAITELNTAIAILGNNGIKGQDAGTSLKQALLQLTGPSNTAKAAMQLLADQAQHATISLSEQNDVLHGGAKARNAALASIKEHNKGLKDNGDIAYDASGKMRSLRDILALTAAGTKNMTQEQRNFALTTIFGSDSTRALLALLKGGVGVYDKQRQAVLEQGAAAKVSAAKNAGLGGAIDNVKSQFENAAIAIYNAVKGPLTTGLNSAAGALTPLAGGITGLANFVRNNAGVFGAFAAVIAGAAGAFVTLKVAVFAAAAAQKAWAAIQAGIAFVQLAAGVRSFAEGWALLDAAMAANPIGIVVVAIGALVAGIIYAYKHSETFRNIVQAVWGAIKTAISATVDWIVNVAWPAIVKAWDAIAAAGLWLWHNVIEPVWHGIQAVINFVVAAVRTYIAALVAEFKFIAGIALWLWHNVFEPVFNGISKAAQIFYLVVEVIFKAVANVIQFVVGRAVNWLRDVWNAAFNWISDKVRTWWLGVQIIFGYFQKYVLGPVVGALRALAAWFQSIFAAIGGYISSWWNAHVSPIFTAVRNAWNTLALGFSVIYNTKIKPVFDAFVGFIKGTVVKGFQTGVSLISKAWSAVQAAAKAPVTFVVNHVINPFINGLNKAASIVGVKDRVEPIKGFAVGGQIPGYASGGKISGAPSAVDNRPAPATIPGVGAVKLAGGEYVVNAQDTAKALPLLKWVNAGMKGGANSIGRYLGRPLAEMPGDGSEGWAFKDGGLVGWTKDIWGALSNPGATIRKPFEALLGQIPGVGMIKDFLIGSAKKFLGSAIGWITGIGGPVSGSLNNVQRAVQARAFVQNQAGKPYIWASAGPRGYDCSGIVSAAYNILKGNNPYSHTFSTESLPGRWFDTRQKIGTLMAGWSHPGQSPASAGVGHMAGQIAGMPFESTGSSGVRIGARARRITQFANTGAARASGGLIDFPPVRLFDKGGLWPSGTLGANMSGRTEYVDPTGRGGSRTYQITVNVAPGGHPVEVGRQTVIAIQAFENANGATWRKP